MGRIKTKEIKDAALELLKKYPDKWKTSFDENKKIADELKIFSNKKTRNDVIGYLTRKIAQRNN
ncbi:MAG: 30S ribosomal protein S17e [Candidatus Aenigmarchaeota archaeon]|nr:30S ribosomal protein S17e [Candidatus Aenigmarchaeota archaeon]